MLLSAQGLSLLAGKRLHLRAPSGMTQRFIARARSEGIEINGAAASEGKQPFRPVRLAAVCAVAATVLIAGLLAIRNGRVFPFVGHKGHTVAPLSSNAAA